jgi:diadenosine tetraphosphatase ApaH/serine/threonine PP2A family protein phosphatase
VPFGIFGHSHIPTYAHCRIDDNGKVRDFRFFCCCDFHISQLANGDPMTVTLPRERIAEGLPVTIFNPGSVGQPRHGSPAACYGIVEVDDKEIRLSFLSVMYAVEETQRRMMKENLPPNLAFRLGEGR